MFLLAMATAQVADQDTILALVSAQIDALSARVDSLLSAVQGITDSTSSLGVLTADLDSVRAVVEGLSAETSGDWTTAIDSVAWPFTVLALVIFFASSSTLAFRLRRVLAPFRKVNLFGSGFELSTEEAVWLNKEADRTFTEYRAT